MTIKVTIKLTPEAQQKLDAINDWLYSPEAQAQLTETIHQRQEQRRRERHAEYFRQARLSMLRWDLYRARMTRPRWWFAEDASDER